MVICENCGQQNAEDASFCANPSCGAWLESGGEGPGGAPDVGERVVPDPDTTESPSERAQDRAERAPFMVARPKAPRGQTAVADVKRTQVRAGLALALVPRQLAVEPGSDARCEIRIRNTGTIVDQYALEVLGDAAQWASVEPSFVNMYPDSLPAVAELRFRPPRTAQTPSGPAPFTVRAVSTQVPTVAATIEGTLDVAGFAELGGELVPQTSEGRFGTAHQVTVRNAGNTAVRVQLAGSDPDAKLQYAFAPDVLLLAPGEEGSSLASLRPRKRLWLGSPEHRLFEIRATPDRGAPLTVAGQMHQVPIIPKWVPKFAVLALAGLIALVTWLFLSARIPELAGLDHTAAVTRLQIVGFSKVPELAEPSETVPVNDVIRTMPPAGKRLLKSRPVTVVYSVGRSPVTVPDVAGLDAEVAASQLTGLGFEVTRATEANENAPAGTVVGTSPEAGKLAPKGSVVKLRTSSGPPASAGAAGGAAGGGAAAAGPTVTVTPGSLAGFRQLVGVPSPAERLVVTNRGPGDMTVASVTVAGTNPADFSLAADTCSGATVEPDRSCAVDVVFAPAEAGARSAAVTIASNAAGSPQVASVSGIGLAPGLQVSVPNVAFGAQKVATRSAPQFVTLTNTGTAEVTVAEVSLAGADAGDFIAEHDCGGRRLPPDADCAVALAFLPTLQGERSAQLLVRADAGAPRTQAVALTGAGTSPLLTITPRSGEFSANSPSIAFSVVNNGDAPVTFTRIEILGDADDVALFRIMRNSCGTLKPDGGECEVEVKYTGNLTTVACYDARLELEDDTAAGPTVVPFRKSTALDLFSLTVPCVDS